MKVLGLHLQNFLDFCTLQGLSQPPLKEKFNLLDLDLCDNTVYIDVELYLKVLNHVVQRLDDKALGVKYGRYLNLKSLGLIYEISMKVSNIQEALFYLNEYVDNTFPLIQVVLSPDPNRDNGFELTMQCRGEYGDPASRCLLESFTLVVYRELSAMGSHHEYSLKILFDRCCSSSAPSDLPVIFASQYGVSAERYNLEHSLDGLKKIKLGELIPAFLEQMNRVELQPSPNHLAMKTKAALLNLGNPALPSLGQVADFFNMSVRNFQRALQQECTSFRKIREGVKVELAKHLLLNSAFSVQDIASVLGYTAPSAFLRSFKKSTNKTPLKFRKELWF